MADDNAEEEEASGKGGLVKIIGGAVVLLGLGGAAGFGGAQFLGGGGDEETEEEVADAEGEGEEAAEGEDAEDGAAPERAVMPLDIFNVNLRGTGGGRVLRMEVQLEVDAAQLEEVEANKAQLKDGVLTLASDYTYADLEGVDGKMRLRDELLTRLNAGLGESRIERIYFTQFVVQ